MKILKIVTNSGYAIEISHVESNNTVNLKITDTNKIGWVGISFEINESELHELLDFLEVMEDSLEVGDMLDDNPSIDMDNRYIRFNRDVQMPFSHGYIVMRDFNTEPLPPGLQFPSPDDIENWLNEDKDNE